MHLNQSTRMLPTHPKLFQQQILNAKRYELLNLFCEYDLGKISHPALISKIESMGIVPTLELKKYLRHSLGSLNFSQFLIALGTPNDGVVELYDKQNDPKSIHHVAPYLHNPNPTFQKYTPENDFLKWSIPYKNPTFDSNEGRSEDAQLDPKTDLSNLIFSNNGHLQQETSERTQLSVSSDADSEYLKLRKIFRMFCAGDATISHIEAQLKSMNWKLTPQQEKVLAKCRVRSDIQLNELYLAFRNRSNESSVGNFSAEEGLKAYRNPLLFRDHTSDIITWRDENDVYRHKNMVIRPKKMSPSKKTYPDLKQSQSLSHKNILKWDNLTNLEYNEKNLIHERIKYAPYTNSYRSQLAFDGSHMRPVQDAYRHGQGKFDAPMPTKDLPHTKSHQHLLSWDVDTITQEQRTKSSYRDPKTLLTWEKYRHDDRVPYTD